MVVKICRQCKEPVEYLSRQGLCPRCSDVKMIQAISELRNKKGKVYERWRKAIVESTKRKKREEGK